VRHFRERTTPPQPQEGGQRQPPEAGRNRKSSRGAQRSSCGAAAAPEEQIVVQQPLRPAATPALPLFGQRRRTMGRMAAAARCPAELLQHLHVRRSHLQSGVRRNIACHGLGVGHVPAAQHFKAGPVQLKEQIAHRVVQGPARLAVGQGRTGQQVQLLPQGLPGLVLRSQRHPLADAGPGLAHHPVGQADPLALQLGRTFGPMRCVPGCTNCARTR
jgi:hypothetical protein